MALINILWVAINFMFQYKKPTVIDIPLSVSTYIYILYVVSKESLSFFKTAFQYFVIKKKLFKFTLALSQTESEKCIHCYTKILQLLGENNFVQYPTFMVLDYFCNLQDLFGVSYWLNEPNIDIVCCFSCFISSFPSISKIGISQLNTS